MVVFNIIVKIIFALCMAWSVGLMVFFFIKRHIETKKKEKQLEEVYLNETTRQDENKPN